MTDATSQPLLPTLLAKCFVENQHSIHCSVHFIKDSESKSKALITIQIVSRVYSVPYVLAYVLNNIVSVQKAHEVKFSSRRFLA